MKAPPWFFAYVNRADISRKGFLTFFTWMVICIKRNSFKSKCINIFHLSLNQTGKFTIRISVAPTISEDWLLVQLASSGEILATGATRYHLSLVSCLSGIKVKSSQVKLTGRSLNFMEFIEIKMSKLQPDNPLKLLNK